jgi:S1-C subfamily serine protease
MEKSLYPLPPRLCFDNYIIMAFIHRQRFSPTTQKTKAVYNGRIKEHEMKKIILLSFFMVFWGLAYSQSDELTGTGTGFFVSDNGLIVTCAHVVEDSTKVTVKLNNNEYQAEILKKDSSSDIAVLKINYRNTHHFKLANFNTANLGDAIWVLGFPLSEILGSDIRLTNGTVSSKSGINSDQVYFQHSAPIQPGNSGGPIINNRFEVIGVAAAKLNDMFMLDSIGSVPQNVNFGVKSNYISQNNQNLRFGGGNVKTMNDAVKATVQILCYEASLQDNALVRINNKTG